MTPSLRSLALGSCLLALPVLSGCGEKESASEKKADTAPKSVPVTIAPAARKTVERNVEVVGSLKGWETVTLGTRREGRVRKVLHDMGDRVKPGEPLVELETEDAKFSVLQAKSKYLADLARIGITQKQAEAALARYGVTEALLMGDESAELIEQSPPIVQATVAVEKAQNNLNRQRQLNARGAGTVEELQNSENDFKASKASRDNALTTARNVIATAISSKVAIDLAEQTLKDMTVVAPTPSLRPEGVTESLTYAIARRSVSEGQMLRVGDPVMELVIQNPLRMWASVPERFSADVKLSQPVRLSVAAYPDTTFEGTVVRINPTVDTASRTFQVEVLIPNNRALLRPGGFAKASILTDKNAEAKVVPVESVVKFAGVTKLFIVDGSVARAINVETGQEGPGWVEVFGDLPAEAKVVVTGQSQLAEGTPVLIREAEEAKVAAKPATGQKAPAQ